MSLPSGTRLGPYRLVDRLGAGGMGEVYRARDERLARDVAVKVILEARQADDHARARFAQEARAVAALSHPNVVRIYDVGTEGAWDYAVTELLEGETLRERLGRGRLDPSEARSIAIQILQGLGAAHARGVIHRDLKPENVFVTSEGTAKILDFGLARMSSAPAGPEDETVFGVRTGTGVVVGTLTYMAPEQLEGRAVDARTDLFAFGCVFFELLAGRRPFEGTSAAATAAAILRSEPALTGVPPTFRNVIASCLQKDPSLRPASAEDVLRALQDPEPPLPRRTRNRWMFWSAAAGILVAVLVVKAILREERGAVAVPTIDSLAVLPLENLSGDGSQDYFADGMTEALLTSLAQIGSLKVISRTSVMQYKGTQKRLPRIARELGAEGIVEGSVLRAGDRIRITVQLIHGPTDRHLWARSYERPLADVLALQNEVASAVADEVRAAITPEEAARLGRPTPRVSPAALELYLKGRSAWSRRTPESHAAAIALLEEATRIEPRYAAAWAALADVHSIQAQGGLAPAAEAFERARAAARRAIELDPELGEAHVSLGFILANWERRWDEGAESFRRGIALSPSHATAHQWYASLLYQTNRREEALRLADRAVQLDPLAGRIRTVRAMFLYFEGRAAEATKELEASRSSDPIHANQLLSDLAADAGDEPKAMAYANACCSTAAKRQAQLAYVHARFGRKSEAERILRELEPLAVPAAPPLEAKAWIAMGDHAPAFRSLLRDPATLYVPYVVGHPAFAPLRADPRYDEVLRAVKLGPYWADGSPAARRDALPASADDPQTAGPLRNLDEPDPHVREGTRSLRSPRESRLYSFATVSAARGHRVASRSSAGAAPRPE